jgi:8-oxo-dGTP diphosphatase
MSSKPSTGRRVPIVPDGPLGRLGDLPRRLARKVYRTGLIGFGRLPHRLQRWVVRIASPSYTVGALLVLEHEGAVLVLRQLHREGWTLPGGLLDHGETPAHGGVREIGEELGLVVDIDPDRDLPTATLVEPHSQRVDVIFHRVVDQRPDVQPRGEAFRVSWRPLHELTQDDQDAVTRDVLLLLRRARHQ